MILLCVATQYVDIVETDGEGNEYAVQAWRGGYATMVQYVFGGDETADCRYLSCVNVSGQGPGQIIPDPNATVVYVWTDDPTLADDIDARDDMSVLRSAEVEKNGEKPADW